MVWMRSAHSNPRHVRILLVDDNQDGIIARRAVLEELNYSVVTASCGADALQRVESERFDLVVTDYKMQPMDGLQLIAELRKSGFNNPIILLSGFAETLGLNPESTGADAVLQKSANEIANLVRSTQRLLNPKKPAHRVANAGARKTV